jgi:hypothetical protein
MGFLDKPLRVDIGEGEWIDVRRIAASEFREMQKTAAKAKPQFDGDDAETAGNFEMLRLIRERIVAWSDPAEVTPENIDRLPIDINATLAKGIGAGSADVPLPNGSPSIATSTE